MTVRTNEILIGSKENPILSLDNDNIISVNGNLACDLLCETIPIDTLEIKCRYDRMQVVFSPIDYNGMRTSAGKQVYARSTGTEDVLNIPYASGLWYYNGGLYIGKFYVVDAQRTGKSVYTIKAQSAIGILDVMPYYGKLFVNTPLSDAIKDIILTDGMRRTATPFLLEIADSIVLGDGLDSITVTGWIPVCTKRAALHHVLFAQGINILKAENDSFLITKISNAEAGEINPNDEYDSGTVDLTERVKSVDVTEHAYVKSPNTEPVVLYDNTEAPIDLETTVVFDSAPIVAASLTVSGSLTILSSNENCAVVSGVGILTGIPYTHTTHVVSRTNGSSADGKSISVSDATLVNAVNSNAVADRLYAYYTSKRDIQIPIVLSGQRCGMRYSCTTPFGDKREAFLVSMTINASAIAKADCKMVSGYEHPEKPGELMHMVLLTGNGIFQVPSEVLESENPRLRVVLIGGGQGGGGGTAGSEGPSSAYVRNLNDLGQPGNPGINGEPGKILSIQIDGNKIKKEYSYSCGSGGKGGPAYGHGVTQSPGDIGEKTVFGTFSSDRGVTPVVGYQDPLSGRVYGGPSPDFSKIVKSGKGGGIYLFTEIMGGLEVQRSELIHAESGVVVINEYLASRFGYELGAVMEFPGGNGLNFKSLPGSLLDGTRSGGGGGGPVVQENPGVAWYYYDGSDAVFDGKNVTGGNGGNGAGYLDAPTPFAFSDTAFGRGGIGGHGGGGGGAAGECRVPSDYTITEGKPGSGGFGGAGSDGAPGCILVYY